MRVERTALHIGMGLIVRRHVVGFDIDAAALGVCSRNCEEMEITTVDLVQCDLSLPPDSRWRGFFDTVVMNPPFGTRTKGKWPDKTGPRRGQSENTGCFF